MERLTLVQQVFASVVQPMLVVFQERRVPRVPVNVALLQPVLDKPLDLIAMLQIMFVNVLRQLMLVVEHQIPALVVSANVVHQMLAVFQGKHVVRVLASVVLHLVVQVLQLAPSAMLPIMYVNVQPRLHLVVVLPILVQMVYVNAGPTTHAAFLVKLVNLELANAAPHLHVPGKHPDHIVMQQTMSVSAQLQLTHVVEQRILVQTEFANVVHRMLAAFQGKHVAQVRVSVVRLQVVLD